MCQKVTAVLFFLLIIFPCLQYPVFISNCYGITSGIYENVSRPNMKLDIEEGIYDHWIERGDDLTELQEGSYKIRGNVIYFSPELSDVGQLNPSRAVILDDCRIKWGEKGIFVLPRCKGAERGGKARGNVAAKFIPNTFPKRWRIERKADMEVYVPENAKVKMGQAGLTISYNGAKAGIVAVEQGQDSFDQFVSACRPNTVLRGRDNTWFYVCGQGARHKYLEIVTKAGLHSPGILTYVAADDMPTLKALSIAVSSLKQVGIASPSVASTGQSVPVSFKKWQPADRSFSISVPDGWNIQGGTADLGRNGYVRIVQAQDPKTMATFIGVYYPFYQFSQTPYGGGGIQPMDAKSYIRGMFFTQLAQSYHIVFDNLRIGELRPLPDMSQKFTRQAEQIGRQMGISVSLRYEVVSGRATCTKDGRPFDMSILGLLQYTTMPLSGMGYSYSWGPAPIYVEMAQRGQLARWFPVFSKMASSWQVSSSWLVAHNRRAISDARQTIQHFRNMAKIIHENAQMRLETGMKEWESQENQEMEIFWDTYHALGGEDRYDDPQTGEEIDVPTGADKYLYDRLSQTWIGIHEDQYGAQDLVEELKQKGFVELRPHTY